MHRSGTSCLTGIMQRMGIELGEVFTENEFNKKGNRENSTIVNVNDTLLRLHGGAWNNPVIATEWNDAARTERDRIVKELSSQSDNWGFKDPRALFTLDYWMEGIPDMKFIGTYRHPYRVALSLNNRDNTPIEEGMQLWKAYNQQLLKVMREHNVDLVNFDMDQEQYLADVIAKLIKLGISDSKADAASDFFDTSLRNQTGKSVDEIELPNDIAEVYGELNNYFASR